MLNWGINKKLWFLTSFIILNIIIFAGTNYYFLGKLSNTINELGQKQIQSVRNMTLADMMHDAIRAEVFGAILAKGNPEKIKESKVAFDELSTNFINYLNQVLELNKDSKEISDFVMETMPKAVKYNEASKGIIELTQSGKQSTEENMKSFNIAFDELAEKMEKLGDSIVENSKSSAISGEQLATRANNISIIIALIVIIVSFIFSFFINQGLVNSLSTIIDSLKDGSEKISEASNAVADVSTKLASSSTQQATSLQETAASLEEISAMVDKNADNTKSSTKSADETSLVATYGKEKVSNMVDAINLISNSNDDIMDQMNKSNVQFMEIIKVINEISEKTKIINDIVFQTKLLSFNASVEAARAGENGKGFAVVAQEVGNLATMSGSAANDISTMLHSSVEKVNFIVNSSKSLTENLLAKSKTRVDAGKSAASECVKSLENIIENIVQVDSLIKEIANASQEQSAGVREINKAVSELDHATQSNVTLTQATANSAKSLKDQSEKLYQLISELSTVLEGKKEHLES
ncbi:MAG: HAMP domain-containing methyl-accepting chemotaxis protein [Bacteriovoracaceae bacterium]